MTEKRVPRMFTPELKKQIVRRYKSGKQILSGRRQR